MATKGSLKDKKVLLTCGPTWVPLDRVRVISNISTGELGHWMAHYLKQAGAKVTMLEGPVTHSFQSHSVRVMKYNYYGELSKLLERELKKGYRIVIHAAAVSDYQPSNPFGVKIQSDFAQIKLTLVPTEKLITKIKTISPKSFLVGFKLECHRDSEFLVTKAYHLMQNAHCDLVVANTQHENKYFACIIDKEKRILAKKRSRHDIAKSLIDILGEKI